MSKLDLFNKPQTSYGVYQGILFLKGSFIIYIISLFLDFNLLRALIGYFTGCLAITIGFYLIIISADRILSNSSNEKQAKSLSLMFFIGRYIIYLLVCGLSVTLFDANIITIVIGMFSLKFIIFIDNIIQKSGGDS